MESSQRNANYLVGQKGDFSERIVTHWEFIKVFLTPHMCLSFSSSPPPSDKNDLIVFSRWNWKLGMTEQNWPSSPPQKKVTHYCDKKVFPCCINFNKAEKKSYENTLVGCTCRFGNKSSWRIIVLHFVIISECRPLHGTNTIFHSTDEFIRRRPGISWFALNALPMKQ